MLTNKDILTPPTFLSYSLGCRTNQAEIENISLQLSAYGFTPYSPPCTSAPLHLCTYPTIVMLNTCVVTKKAEKETRQKIRELRKKFPDSFLVVLGCAVTAKEKFKIDLPKADLLISNEEKPQTINLILKQINTKLSDSMGVRYNPSVNKYQLSGRKFIKIQDGCDKFCSFCLTCLIRGKPASIPPQEIIKEINFGVDKGIKEIVLTGINIGLYGKDLKTANLIDLLKKILSKTNIGRISLSSFDPQVLLQNPNSVPLIPLRTVLGQGQSFSELSKLMVNNQRVSQYLHLSLQSGSSTVLERMNRRTDLDKLLEMLKTIKKQNPFFTFRADIIVGFPNETEKEFEETINFIKKAKISFVHSFLFSFRPGTKLEGMIKSGKWQEVASTVKKQRARILGKVVEKIRNNEAMKQSSNVTNCLIVRSLSRYIAEGITENGWPIIVQSSKCKVQSYKGKILTVKIIKFENDYLWGEIVSLPT